MPGSRPWIASLFALLFASIAPAPASEIGLLPASARLDGPNARQRFLVEVREGDAWVGDRSPGASFAIDNPRVATVSADGTVTPTGDGMATLTAIVGGQTARASISVENFGARPRGASPTTSCRS